MGGKCDRSILIVASVLGESFCECEKWKLHALVKGGTTSFQQLKGLKKLKVKTTRGGNKNKRPNLLGKDQFLLGPNRKERKREGWNRTRIPRG